MSYIVISGLPASGKSTLARDLAPALGLVSLDKDDFLEALFEGRDVRDPAERTRLSRAADAQFEARAREVGRAVLTSWWRHPATTGTSGTPTAWLASLSGGVLEVHCVCDPATAAARFVQRARHPGHLDGRRSAPELAAEFEEHARHGPLGVGPVIRVGTDRAVEGLALAAEIRVRLHLPA